MFLGIGLRLTLKIQEVAVRSKEREQHSSALGSTQLSKAADSASEGCLHRFVCRQA